MIITKEMKNNQRLRQRAYEIAEFIITNKTTVRETAKHFGISKSTAHTDLVERVKKNNPELYREVKYILDYHKSIRHLRGGEATKKLHIKNKIKNNMSG